MNKMICLICFSVVLIMGCSNLSDAEKVPLHPMLSNDKNNYSLLVIDETGTYEMGNEWQEQNEIGNVKSVHGRTSLEQTREEYKFLEIDNSPIFIVFNTKEAVFQTENEEKLIEFLKSNNP
ncbi:hypothetical protein [Rossellomorea aquimaris]|uniref:hypothetical protein n=1 Tax=Rossellomorea aquimaris TaxID=189382 RepID=UPI0007D0A860|nr:hypothetical protein [Rossellomorea aquimaris]